VLGYLMYALGIHENISRPWSNISCALDLLVREYFDGYSRIADQWRNCLDDFLVFVHFLPVGEFVT